MATPYTNQDIEFHSNFVSLLLNTVLYFGHPCIIIICDIYTPSEQMKSYINFSFRDFIENHLLEFTRDNPGIVVYLKPQRHRPPKIVAEYCKLQLSDNVSHAILK